MIVNVGYNYQILHVLKKWRGIERKGGKLWEKKVDRRGSGLIIQKIERHIQCTVLTYLVNITINVKLCLWTSLIFIRWLLYFKKKDYNVPFVPFFFQPTNIGSSHKVRTILWLFFISFYIWIWLNWNSACCLSYWS